ncbi:zinc finger protein 185 isoform X2 [Ictalurus punctatus]|uniref:Zinc finger protein 185 isoform X2 n=1 Tax=Ictalurus punctatus TaxID=7998 RepID=A0A9F7TMN8_ICTPU|nr:zinc finger protein 185 isoform X2 [Ictalurus punctatus]
MSTGGDRQSVLRTTKVRATLKGDNSWIQRNQSELEEEEDEKPWLAEVRARRLDSDASEPVADDKPPEREPLPSPSPNRGVFTKTDTKPASSTNGYIGTSGFTKKASEGYKKIAPHTVRSSTGRTEPSEPSLSAEEQERRSETASKMLNSSASRQRSYVLSAANKFESSSGNTSSASSSTAFVAKRVVIGDDEDTLVSLPNQSVEMSVDEPMPPKSTSATAELKPKAKPEPTPKQSDTLSALSDTLLSTSGSTSKKPVVQVNSPVPVTKKPEANLKTSVKDTITQSTSVAPVAALKKSPTAELKPDTTPKASATEPVAPAVKEVPPTTPEPKPKPDATPKPSINPKPVEKTGVLIDTDLLDLTESTPQKLVNPVPTTTDLLSGGSLPKTPKTKGSLDLLAVDIIPIDTSTDQLSTNKTNTKIEITQTVVQTKKDVKSTQQNLVDPIPTTTDLLTGGLRTDKTQSTMETTTTVTTKTKTVEKSSADPFDPIPIVRESTKSSVEYFDPLLSDRNNGQQQTVSVTFEQKSSKTSSPWEKWTVPTIDSATEDSKPMPDPEPTDDYNAYTSSYNTYTRTEGNSFPELDTEIKKNLVYVKSYVKSSDLPRFSTSRYDNDYDYVTSSSSSYAYSSPSSTESMSACKYCGRLVGNDSKITIDHLNILCHPECFKCGICTKPMGDFIDSMFLHNGMVHCESCYSNVI